MLHFVQNDNKYRVGSKLPTQRVPNPFYMLKTGGKAGSFAAQPSKD